MQALANWLRKRSGWIESQQASILSAALVIQLANVGSALAGVLRNRALNTVYPTGAIDAYFVAFRLPEFLFQLFVLGALTAAFVPMFAPLFKHNERARAMNLANQVLIILMALFSLGSIVIALNTPLFVRLITSEHFPPDQFATAVSLTRIMLISQLLFGVSGVFSGMLQSAKRFVLPAFSPLFYNFGIIISVLLLGARMGTAAAAWGTVFGAFLHMAIQVPLALRLGYRPFWPRFERTTLQRFLTLVAPRTLTIGVEQLALFAVTFYTTSLAAGSLAIITYAQQLMAIPIRVFGVPIGQAALPFLTHVQDDMTEFRQLTFRSLRQIAFFAVPASVFLLVLRVPLVRLALGADKFEWNDTLATALALAILSLSIAAQAATTLLARAFYALNNTRIPLFSSLAYMGITLTGCWLLTRVLGQGLPGIALALSAAGIVEALILFVCLMHRIGWQGVGELIWSLTRTAIAGFLMAVTLFVFQRLFDLYVFETSRTFALLQLTIIVSLMGTGVYLGLALLLRIEELTILATMVQKVRQSWSKVVRSTPEFVDTPSNIE